MKTANAVSHVAAKKIKLADIIYDDANPNRMTDPQKAALAKTISKYGFAGAPWVHRRPDGKYGVIDGEHRLKYLSDMGEKAVSCHVFDVTGADVRILRQVANKLRGHHDRTADAAEISRIFNDGNLAAFASHLGEHEDIFRSMLERAGKSTTPESADAAPTPTAKPKSKTGQTYGLGRHTIHCGDCNDILPGLTGDMELLLTDPPYGINVVTKPNQTIMSLATVTTRVNGKPIRRHNYRPVMGDDVDFDPKPLLQYCHTQMIFGANHYHDKLPLGRHWLVWDKKFADGSHDTITSSDCELIWTSIDALSVKIYRHIWTGMTRAGSQQIEGGRLHPTQKPVGLLEQIIRDHTKPNDTILDPYLGSGSTLIAAERTGRVCVGIEIDPYYVDVVIARWEKATGQRARLARK